jgi:glycosyltransferase involved in cell wall biosynthesis
MMTEAAIVATDVGGVREALGNTGMLVEPRNPAAMAEALSVLLASPERRVSLGRSARERAVEWFSERRFADAYLAAYDRLVTPASALPAGDPLEWIEPDLEPVEPAIA